MAKHRHPFLRGWPPGVWCPHAVDVVPGYPKTEADHLARVERAKKNLKPVRKGEPKPKKKDTSAGVIPRTLSRYAPEVKILRKNFRREAERIVKFMEAHDMVAYPDGISDEDKQLAKDALTAAITIVRDTTVAANVRGNIIKTILDFTKAKPEQRAAIRASPEDYLEAVAARALSMTAVQMASMEDKPEEEDE